MTRPAALPVGILVFLTLLGTPGAARAEPPVQQPAASRGVLLDVPYLTQTEQLCGGAALAMVLRYWGDATAAPEEFAPLIDRSEGGIRASVLTDAVTRRGWNATPFASDPATALDWLRDQIDRGRPVIALIEDRPNAFHYVVVAAVTPTDVVVHDPARAPYRVLARETFQRVWTAAGNWMLTVLPPADRAVAPPASVPRAANSPLPASPCDGLVADSVALARTGTDADAERGLLAASTLCPSAAAPLIELAGLRFRERRYADSVRLAEQGLALASSDVHARELLATSLFLLGERFSALAAWNVLDQPRVTNVTIDGASQTRHPVIVGMAGLKTGQLLTPSVLSQAERRLAELPTAAVTALRYEPAGNGLATVTASLTERPVLPPGPLGWALVGVGAAFRRELVMSMAGATGGGETITGGYRYGRNRPRVRGEIVAPAPGPLPGIVRIEGMWDRQSYGAVAGPAEPTEIDQTPIREERRRGGGQIADWATSWLRWQAGAALEHVDDRKYISVDGRLITRWFGDRVAARVAWSRWTPQFTGDAFNARDASLSWRTTTRSDRLAFLGRAGMAMAGDAAPLALLPVASSSQNRGVLLRAHDLYNRDGVITNDLLGHRLAFGTIELVDPVYVSPYGSIGVAAFVDFARAWERRFADAPSPLNADVGGGVRIDSPASGGQIRLDVAYGLRNKETRVTAGYVLPWGQ